ncbi:hypothetical protein Pint_28402 [Pistacia integerrima]|uniref:Uncharacterized protein n=1 Tax=Pistacia integerrima TaxID=434235 RepID=A0ACC0YRS5_9ROSI|nr:hypothetical protein Pint_28402 [Pistacia integerrima]
MDTTKEDEKVEDDQRQQQQQKTVVKKIPKAKSCKGYLYYNSVLKSHHRNPRCIGIPRTLPQVPDFVVRHSELKASKDGRTLIQFYYACLGYSVYNNVNSVSTNKLTNVNDVSTDKQVTRQLPLCTGLELLLHKPPAPTNPVPAPADNREG